MNVSAEHSWVQEAPFARDLSKATRNLTTFEEANASRAKTSRVQCQSAADAGLFALAFTGGWALAAVSANSYAIVNNVVHISKLTATPHPGVVVNVSISCGSLIPHSPVLPASLTLFSRRAPFAFPLTIFSAFSSFPVTYCSSIYTSANSTYGWPD